MTAATFFGVRETLLPGPSQTTGYRTVLIIGPTGAGKTTLVQQLIGSDPERERFPSTSASKTTIAETELLCAPGDYFGVVTFQPKPEIQTYVEECVEAAAIALSEKRPEREVRRRLLQHRDLRFRMHYIIGEGTTVDDEIDDLSHHRTPPPVPPAIAQIRETTEGLIQWILEVLRQLVDLELQNMDPSTLGDEEIEDQLKQRLGDHPYVAHVVDRLMAEIELRFGLLDPDGLTRGADNWPLYWRLQADGRQEFITAINRFSSNSAAEFGTLLTPLVNGIRVRAPFHPIWAQDIPYIMLIDGEGLGHTPESATSLPTAATRMFDMVDTVLIVDNGQQPMQATAAAALHQVAAAGHTEKLAVVFTHFDQVRGPNLVSFGDRRAHVMSSADQIVRSFGNEYGYDAGRALQEQLHEHTFFVGGIHERIDPLEAPRTVEELGRLYNRLRAEASPLDLGTCRPVYDHKDFTSAVTNGVLAFQADWERKLGVRREPGASPVHWTKIKALSRRYARQVSDEHDSLRPVGDLYTEVVDRIRQVIDTPARWSPDAPDLGTQQQIFDLFARGMSGRIRLIANHQLLNRASPMWIEAAGIEGDHAATRRAEYLATTIFGRHIAPTTPENEPTLFLTELLQQITDAAADLDISIQ